MKQFVQDVRAKINVRDIFCTRILKVRGGSVLVGLTADLEGGATLEEADVATLILGDRVDQRAYDRALATSLISARQREEASQLTRNNYTLLIQERLDKVPAPTPMGKIKGAHPELASVGDDL